MPRKRVFISIPMRGRTDEEIKKEMSFIFDQKYGNDEYEFIDTVHYVEGGRVATFAESIRKLSTADICCFAPGWENAGGCVIEKMICDHFDIHQEFYKYPESQIEKLVVMDEYDALKEVGWLVKKLAVYPKDYLFMLDEKDNTLLAKIDHYHRTITLGDRESIENDIMMEQYPNSKDIHWSSLEEIVGSSSITVFDMVVTDNDTGKDCIKNSYLIVGKYVGEETAKAIDKAACIFEDYNDIEIHLSYLYSANNLFMFPLKAYCDPKYAPEDYIFIGTIISPIKPFNGISTKLNISFTTMLRYRNQSAANLIGNIFKKNLPEIFDHPDGISFYNDKEEV